MAAGCEMRDEDVSVRQAPLFGTDDFRLRLAFHHAPVLYMETADDASGWRQDLITSVNYDGDWTTTNNWENLFSGGDMSGVVYYTVIETPTHWYIEYGFYHPRDWSNGSIEKEHENDFEGLLAVVSKDGTTYGKLEVVFTNAHGNLDPFSPPGVQLWTYILVTGLDGQIYPVTVQVPWLGVENDGGIDRVKVAQESGGHACRPWSTADDQDGVVYYPSMTASAPPVYGSQDVTTYRLVDLQQDGGLWDHQLEQSQLGVGTDTFATWGWLAGDKGSYGEGCGGGWSLECEANAASAPWNWGGRYHAELGPDPVLFVLSRIIGGLGTVSSQYCSNPYIEDLKQLGFSSSNQPDGWENVDLDSLYDRLTSVCIQIDTALLTAIL